MFFEIYSDMNTWSVVGFTYEFELSRTWSEHVDESHEYIYAIANAVRLQVACMTGVSDSSNSV